MEAQLEELTATYNQLLDSSTQQLQQLEQQLAQEEERKVAGLENEAGRIYDETFDYFRRDLRERRGFEFSTRLQANVEFVDRQECVCVCVCLHQHVVCSQRKYRHH